MNQRGLGTVFLHRLFGDWIIVSHRLDGVAVGIRGSLKKMYRSEQDMHPDSTPANGAPCYFLRFMHVVSLFNTRIFNINHPPTSIFGLLYFTLRVG